MADPNSEPEPSAALSSEERHGPVRYDYGVRADEDAVHAARLRHVQNLAAVKARTLDSRTGTERARSEVVDPDAIETAQSHARRDAERDGVATEAIDRAATAGSRGVTWTQQPSHRWLGRIEQLTDAVEHASDHAAERLAAAERYRTHLESRIEAKDNYIRELWTQITDAEWLLGNNTRQNPPVVDRPSTLRELTAEPGPDLETGWPRPSATPPPGTDIESAVDSARPQDADTSWTPPEALPAPDNDTDIDSGPNP